MTRIGFMGRNRSLFSVLRKDGVTEIPIPDYVLKNRQRHEYDPEEEAIYKQCIGCFRWLKVAEIGGNNEFVKISDDKAFIQIPSGFRNYCQACFQQEKSDKSERAQQSSFSGKEEKKHKSSNDAKKKRSYHISDENHTYIMVRARLEDKLSGDILDGILDKERKNHKLYYQSGKTVFQAEKQ